MPLAADTPTDRVEQLIVLTERLAGLVKKDTVSLKERRPNELLAGQDETAKLSNLYTQEMELVKSNKALVSGIEQSLSDKLKQVTEQFQAALKEHEFMVKRVRTVTEGVIKAVAKEIAAKNEAQTSYAQDANMAKRNASAPATLTLNEVV